MYPFNHHNTKNPISVRFNGQIFTTVSELAYALDVPDNWLRHRLNYRPIPFDKILVLVQAYDRQSKAYLSYRKRIDDKIAFKKEKEEMRLRYSNRLPKKRNILPR